MENRDVVEENWEYVLSLLPDSLEALCFDKLAMTRRRQVSSPQDLLRLCLAYAVCDMSLRQTAAWASAIGLGELSDVAVLKRLKAAPEWLGAVLAQWLHQRGLTRAAGAGRVRLIDATVVSQPGSRGTDWRLHLRMDLAQRRIAGVELSDASGGERLDRHSIEAGEIAVADRAYATAPGIAHVLKGGGHVVLRSSWSNLPLESAGGKRLAIVPLLQTLGRDDVGDWSVWMRHQGRRYRLRLVAIRKTPQATEKTRRELRRQAKKKGRQLQRQSLKAAEFIFVVTDLAAEEVSPLEVLELYRLRWQVELSFKRLKSLLGFGRLRAKDPRLCQSYLLGKILGALIVEALSGEALDFFPWGFRLPEAAA